MSGERKRCAGSLTIPASSGRAHRSGICRVCGRRIGMHSGSFRLANHMEPTAPTPSPVWPDEARMRARVAAETVAWLPDEDFGSTAC